MKCSLLKDKMRIRSIFWVAVVVATLLASGVNYAAVDKNKQANKELGVIYCQTRMS